MRANPKPPIVCDMTTAPDTTEERLARYQQLFGGHLTARERTPTGIRFRFRADAGVADEVRDLAAREKTCCAFFDFTIAETGDEVTWDASVVDDPLARQILEEYYQLPDTIALGGRALFERFTDQGLDIVIDDHGVQRPATRTEIGLPSD
jgi:hypothetical protein